MDKWFSKLVIGGWIGWPKLDLWLGSKLGIGVGHSPSSWNVVLFVSVWLRGSFCPSSLLLLHALWQTPSWWSVGVFVHGLLCHSVHPSSLQHICFQSSFASCSSSSHRCTSLWWQQQTGRNAAFGRGLLDNGFPKNVVKRALSSPCPSRTLEDHHQEEEDEAKKPLFLTYVRGVSEKLEKVCIPLGVKPVFMPQNTLRNMLMHVTEKTPLRGRKRLCMRFHATTVKWSTSVRWRGAWSKRWPNTDMP